MFPNTSIHRKNRLKMVASVSMTALTALGAAVLFPHGASHSALAATMTSAGIRRAEPQPDSDRLSHQAHYLYRR